MEHVSFAWGAAAAVLALSLYYGDERSFIHRGAAEGAFWFCIYAWGSFVLLILPDSPLIQLRLLIQVGGADHVALVLLAGLFGIRIHRQRRTNRMSSLLQQLNLQDLVKLQAETVPARIATSRVLDCLHAKPGLLGLLRGGRARQQVAVVEAMEDCCQYGAQHLLYVLNSGDIDLPYLFEVVRVQELFQLLLLLLPHMDVVTKAKLIDAMQRQTDFYFQRPLQEFVVEVLTQTYGEELTTIKNLMDEGGDFYNFHKLVFSDLPQDLREVALQHVRQEGARVRDANAVLLLKVLSDIDDTLYCSGGHFPAGADRRFSKGQLYPGVLALFRELGRQQQAASGPAGSPSRKRTVSHGSSGDDERTPRASPRASGSFLHVPPQKKLTELLFANMSRVVRPLSRSLSNRSASQVWLRASAAEWTEVTVSAAETVADLQARLEAARLTGSGCAEGWESLSDISFSPPTRRSMSNLVFLSARPHAYKDYLESKSYQLFRRLRARGMLHCMPTLLPGRIKSSGAAALRGAVLQFHTPLGAALATMLAVALVAWRSPVHPQVVLCALVLGSYAYFSVTTRKNHKQATSVWAPVGEDKRKIFLEFRQLYSECDAVFFGDNGQGDLLCAELLAEDAQDDAEDGQAAGADGRAGGDDRLAAPVLSFIHEVVPRDEMLTSLPSELSEKGRERIWANRNIRFHRTYVGAAVNACDCGLISCEALARVARSAVEDCVRLCATQMGHVAAGNEGASPPGQQSELCCESLISEINQDVEAANDMLPMDMQPIDLVPRALGGRKEKAQVQAMRGSVSLENFFFVTPAARLDIG